MQTARAAVLEGISYVRDDQLALDRVGDAIEALNSTTKWTDEQRSK